MSFATTASRIGTAIVYGILGALMGSAVAFLAFKMAHLVFGAEAVPASIGQPIVLAVAVVAGLVSAFGYLRQSRSA